VMNTQTQSIIERTKYDIADCKIGIVHLGFGAFHRAHQAVYIDDYMQASDDLNWGIAAVNLRAEESEAFEAIAQSKAPYLLKTTSAEGETFVREVRSHVHFEDWSNNASAAEELISQASVKVVSMTVTESGYYLAEDWSVNPNEPVIAAEIAGTKKQSVYAFLASALKRRMQTINQPITILCCDNIRANGNKLRQNFHQYLELIGDAALAKWITQNATFPNSMVDRITPRATPELREEIALISSDHASTAIHGESFSQWVLEKKFASDFPKLNMAGVEIVEDVDPYEEAKIRILNGGHTGLCYLGALAGHQTFDQAMEDPKLREHFDGLEFENVLPGLTIELPFDKRAYCHEIAARFANKAIADDLARICMDGWSKFPIYVRPTLRSCLHQGISPTFGYDAIASWYVYARRFAMGQTHINYFEPYWDQLKPLLEDGKEQDFASLESLWSDLPTLYQEFAPQICAAITRMETQWPA